MKTQYKHILGATGFAMVFGWTLRGVLSNLIDSDLLLFMIGWVAITGCLMIQFFVLRAIYGDTLS